jgi:hypothetical protein
MYNRLWDCLNPDDKIILMLYQRANHKKHWMPPEELQRSSVKVYFSGNNEPDPETVRVMTATPGQVRHWPQEKKG